MWPLFIHYELIQTLQFDQKNVVHFILNIARIMHVILKLVHHDSKRKNYKNKCNLSKSFMTCAYPKSV